MQITTNPLKLDGRREVGLRHFFRVDEWRGTEKGLQLLKQFAEVRVKIAHFSFMAAHTSSAALRRALTAMNSAAGQRAR